MRTIILFTMVILSSCKSSISNNTSSSTQVKKETEIISAKTVEDNNLKIDPLRDPNNHRYLTDLPLHQVAELMLADSVSPSDNDITYALLYQAKASSDAENVS